MKSKEITSVDNIKKLWVLKLILETGSLRKAAQCVKVSPASISQTLSALEKIYQKPLVLRKNNNKIEPTKEAQKLIKWVSPVFQALDNLDIQLKTKVPPIAYINLGAIEDFAIQYCPSLFKELKAVLPKLKLITYSGRSDDLIKMIRKGQLCSAVVVADESSLSGFYYHVLYEDEFSFFVSAQLKAKGFEKLLKENGFAMLRTSDTGLPSYMSKFLNQFSPKLKPSFLADNLITVRKTAIGGDMMALLPKCITRQEPNNLVEVFPEKPLKYSGRHKVVLISEEYCDREEANFLAKKLKQICPQNVELQQ